MVHGPSYGEEARDFGCSRKEQGMCVHANESIQEGKSKAGVDYRLLGTGSKV